MSSERHDGRIEESIDIFVDAKQQLDDASKNGSTTAVLSVWTAIVDLGPQQNWRIERLSDQLSVHQIHRYQPSDV